MTKHIISLSVDEDDLARIELVKQLYNIKTRSDAVRQAVKLMLNLALAAENTKRERKGNEN